MDYDEDEAAEAGMPCTQLMDLPSPPLTKVAHPQAEEPVIVGRLVSRSPEIITGDYEVKVGTNKIGRDPAQCDLVIDHQTVSRVHAHIKVARNGDGTHSAILQDNNSANQTRINDRTDPLVILNGGEKISFGKVNFEYCLGPSEEEEEDLLEFGNNGHSALSATSPLRTAPIVHVPETPLAATPGPSTTAKKLSFAPSAQSSPALQKTLVPESPVVKEDDSPNNSTFNDSSFIAPTQQVQIGKKSGDEKKESDIYEMDTQAFAGAAAAPAPSSAANSALFDLATQAVGAESLEAKPAENGNGKKADLAEEENLYDVETQAVGQGELSADVTDETYSAETQAIGGAVVVNESDDTLEVKDDTFSAETQALCGSETQPLEVPLEQPVKKEDDTPEAAAAKEPEGEQDTQMDESENPTLLLDDSEQATLPIDSDEAVAPEAKLDTEQPKSEEDQQETEENNLLDESKDDEGSNASENLLAESNVEEEEESNLADESDILGEPSTSSTGGGRPRSSTPVKTTPEKEEGESTFNEDVATQLFDTDEDMEASMILASEESETKAAAASAAAMADTRIIDNTADLEMSEADGDRDSSNVSKTADANLEKSKAEDDKESSNILGTNGDESMTSVNGTAKNGESKKENGDDAIDGTVESVCETDKSVDETKNEEGTEKEADDSDDDDDDFIASSQASVGDSTNFDHVTMEMTKMVRANSSKGQIDSKPQSQLMEEKDVFEDDDEEEEGAIVSKVEVAEEQAMPAPEVTEKRDPTPTVEEPDSEPIMLPSTQDMAAQMIAEKVAAGRAVIENVVPDSDSEDDERGHLVIDEGQQAPKKVAEVKKSKPPRKSPAKRASKGTPKSTPVKSRQSTEKPKPRPSPRKPSPARAKPDAPTPTSTPNANENVRRSSRAARPSAKLSNGDFVSDFEMPSGRNSKPKDVVKPVVKTTPSKAATSVPDNSEPEIREEEEAAEKLEDKVPEIEKVQETDDAEEEDQPVPKNPKAKRASGNKLREAKTQPKETVTEPDTSKEVVLEKRSRLSSRKSNASEQPQEITKVDDEPTEEAVVESKSKSRRSKEVGAKGGKKKSKQNSVEEKVEEESVPKAKKNARKDKVDAFNPEKLVEAQEQEEAKQSEEENSKDPEPALPASPKRASRKSETPTVSSPVAKKTRRAEPASPQPIFYSPIRSRRSAAKQETESEEKPVPAKANVSKKAQRKLDLGETKEQRPRNSRSKKSDAEVAPEPQNEDVVKVSASSNKKASASEIKTVAAKRSSRGRGKATEEPEEKQVEAPTKSVRTSVRKVAEKKPVEEIAEVKTKQPPRGRSRRSKAEVVEEVPKVKGPEDEEDDLEVSFKESPSKDEVKKQEQVQKKEQRPTRGKRSLPKDLEPTENLPKATRRSRNVGAEDSVPEKTEIPVAAKSSKSGGAEKMEETRPVVCREGRSRNAAKVSEQSSEVKPAPSRGTKRKPAPTKSEPQEVAKPVAEEPVRGRSRRSAPANQVVAQPARPSARGRGAKRVPSPVIEAPKVTRGKRKLSPVKAEEDEVVQPTPVKRGKRGSNAGVASNVQESKGTKKSEASGTVASRRKQQKFEVMFTAFDDAQAKKVVKDLGGTITEDIGECTVLVTDKIRRTAKFLCMAAKGIPIVSPNWVKMSKEMKSFQDPWLHIISDHESEKKWGFVLPTSLKEAKKSPLLSGFKVHATPKVMPPPDQIKEIVTCAGGEWLKTMPKTAAGNTFVISCKEDKSLLSQALKKKIQVQDKEILLTGLLKRDLDFKAHSLKV